jgi:uncharacterized protein YukE
MTNGDTKSGIREMDELKDYISKLRQDCIAREYRAYEAEALSKSLHDKAEELQLATHQLRKQVTRALDQANKANHVRYMDQVKSYIEMLIHKLKWSEITIKKFNGYSKNLQKRVDRLDEEREDLHETYKNLRRSTQNVGQR